MPTIKFDGKDCDAEKFSLSLHDARRTVGDNVRYFSHIEKMEVARQDG